MRSIPFAALLLAPVLALVLAGCGGQQPTATAVSSTSVPPTVESVSQGDDQLATLAATMGAAQPGTLVIPDNAETPNAPTAQPVVINKLLFTRIGGIAASSLTIELHGDGTLIRDGKSITVTPDDVKQIASILDQIHFFSLQGIFVGQGGTADAYLYSLSVDSTAGSRTITSQDGMTPPELSQAYDAILALSSGS
ncbi:MAG: hypothetical protein ABI700_28030 [Chloroflexota bacterium]